MSRSNAVINYTELSDGRLQFEVIGAGKRILDTKLAHPDNKARAEILGWKERTVNRAAKTRNVVTGESASPAVKFEAICTFIDHIESGSPAWSCKVEPR